MRKSVTTGFALLALAACDKPPVAWSDIEYTESPVVREAGAVRTFPDLGLCSGSARIAVSGSDSAATWWSIRNDSSSLLMFSRRTGDNWTSPAAIDTTDASHRGCNRPAPAISIAPVTGHVHIAYFLEQRSGPGVFFTHSMDDTGFHDQVAIAYGKRESQVSIASLGDKVAIAYEEPNAERGQVWVALSATMGHIFESRLPVSSSNEVARSPRVALNGTKLDVQWRELVQAGSAGRTRIATRTGTWK